MLATILAATLLIAPLEPLHFLEGTWEASDKTATGKTMFEVVNQGHAILRKNYAVYQNAPRHDDVMVIYAEGAKIRADYWDSEGHIIRYTVTIANGSAVFVSDVIPKAPRFRLTYTPNGKDANGKFEIASPANPDAFAPYLAWSAHRVRE